MSERVEKTVEIKSTGEKVEIYVSKPINEVIKAADRQRSKTWTDCLRDGVIIKKELEVLMEERGIWDKAKTKREEEITKRIISLEKKLYKGDGKKKPKVSEGKKIAIEIRRLRGELRDLIAEKLSMEENTAEALAENAKFDYLVSACTFYKENDERVYNDLDDYNKKSSDEIAFAAATALGEMLYNLDASFEAGLPENRWLKKFKLVDDELSLVNQKGDLVDAEGNKISEEGYFLNSEGKRTDRDGELLDEDGNYIMVDYENDLTPPRKRASSKKTTTAKETQATES